MLKSYNNGLKDTFTPPGSPIRDDFEVQLDENGLECYVKVGETDLQALYDSYRDSCDLSVLVKTLVDSGINPFSSAKITYLEDEPLDITSLQDSSLSDKMEALRNYEKNKKLIDEYIAAQEADKKAKEIKAGGSNE